MIQVYETKDKPERWKDYAGMRLSFEGRHLLRRIAAETGETMIQLVERIAKEEWERVKEKDETL